MYEVWWEWKALGEIILLQYNLERFRKTRILEAAFLCLTATHCTQGGANPIILETTTLPVQAMMEARDFVTALARATEGWQEIKLLLISGYGDKNMS